MNLKKGINAFSAIALIAAFSVSCSQTKNSGSTAGIPAIRPPVSKATPSGLSPSGIASVKGDLGAYSLNSSELQQIFFGAGPAKIDNLLQAVDARMAEINTISGEGEHACLTSTPASYNFSVLGESKTAYFQCYIIMSDNSGGILFGKKDDVWYLYQNIGAGRNFAIVTPVTESPGDYLVEAWFSVGVTNSPWNSGSYGVIHLKANSATKNLEMAVAGTGVGYCGAQLKTDGVGIYLAGSPGPGTSDGTTWTCSAADTACTSATDMGQAGVCTSINSFELAAIGTTSSPYGTALTFNGDSSDAAHFGPTVSELSQITGVLQF